MDGHAVQSHRRTPQLTFFSSILCEDIHYVVLSPCTRLLYINSYLSISECNSTTIWQCNSYLYLSPTSLRHHQISLNGATSLQDKGFQQLLVCGANINSSLSPSNKRRRRGRRCSTSMTYFSSPSCSHSKFISEQIMVPISKVHLP